MIVTEKYKKTIYPRHVVEMACEAFVDVCFTKIEANKDYWKVEFICDAVNTNIIVKEFNNYLIGLLNEGSET